ncbi:unnamed protein product [Symbiodinium natans]|uniref:Sushi domain-containing protein n=1 Tax=Symbiodinium natans TaxID=878477 RepID=A0A812MB19_9DINO|nr:unnamed protein product [Symbiodinium natans]
MPVLSTVILAWCCLSAGATEPASGAEPVSEEGELVFDPANHSMAWANFISCYYGVVCNGSVVLEEGRPVCEGSLQCMNAGGQVPESSIPSIQAQVHTEIRDASRTSSAQSSLLVCHHGSYCRGNWGWNRGRRECAGGLRCQSPADSKPKSQLRGATKSAPHGPGAAGATGGKVTVMQDENSTAQAVGNFLLCWYGSHCPSSPRNQGLGSEVCTEGSECLGVTSEPFNSSARTSNETRHTYPGVSLLSCRFGTVCRGTWSTTNGIRKCQGTLACRGVLWYAAVAEVPLEEGGLRDTLAEATLEFAQAPSYQLACLTQAAAKLQLRAPRLLGSAAAAARSRAEAAALSAQDCALVARGLDALGLVEAPVLAALSTNFLRTAARPLGGEDTGRDWSDMAECLLASSHAPGTAEHELLAAYQDAVIAPLIKHLRAIVSSKGTGERALRSLERFAAALALPGLGPRQSELVLEGAGLATVEDGAVWEEARKAAAARRWAQATRHLAWLQVDVQLRLPEAEERLQEPGRLVAAGRAGVAEQRPRSLRPLALPGVSAAGRHADHQALLALDAALDVAAGRLRRRSRSKGNPEVSGTVHLYVFGSSPCLSFFAALAQLRRRYPNLVATVGFDTDGLCRL